MKQNKKDKIKKHYIRIQKKVYNAKRYEEKKEEIKLKSAIYYKNKTDIDDTYKKMKLDKPKQTTIF